MYDLLPAQLSTCVYMVSHLTPRCYVCSDFYMEPKTLRRNNVTLVKRVRRGLSKYPEPKPVQCL